MAARRSFALAASLAFALAACVGQSTPAEDARGDDAITVASFDFPESVLLAEIYAQAIEGAGIRVEREAALGPRELVMPALLRVWWSSSPSTPAAGSSSWPATDRPRPITRSTTSGSPNGWRST